MSRYHRLALSVRRKFRADWPNRQYPRKVSLDRHRRRWVGPGEAQSAPWRSARMQARRGLL